MSVVAFSTCAGPVSTRSPPSPPGWPRCAREAVAPGEKQAVTARARKQPSLEVFRQVEGVANGAYGGGVLLEQELEGGVLEERPAGVSGDGPRRVLGEKVLDVLGDELEAEPGASWPASPC